MPKSIFYQVIFEGFIPINLPLPAALLVIGLCPVVGVEGLVLSEAGLCTE